MKIGKQPLVNNCPREIDESYQILMMKKAFRVISDAVTKYTRANKQMKIEICPNK